MEDPHHVMKIVIWSFPFGTVWLGVWSTQGKFGTIGVAFFMFVVTLVGVVRDLLGYRHYERSLGFENKSKI